LQFNRRILGKMARFGIAYQLKFGVHFLNGAIIPLYAGSQLGKVLYGLVSWSQTTAYFPLQLLDIIGRVNFPLLSRLQDDRVAFARILERSIAVGALIIHFFIALFVGLGLPLVRVVYGEQWVGAVPTLYVFSAVLTIGFLGPVVASALDAIGQPKIILRLGIFWTTLNWVVISVVFHWVRTAMSFALAYCVHIVIGNLAIVIALRAVAPSVHVFRALWVPMFAAVVAGTLGYFGLARLVGSVVTLVLAVAILFVVYAGTFAITAPGLVRDFRGALRGTDPTPPAEPVVGPAQG
jgi:PST family polysaccharide transporter